MNRPTPSFNHNSIGYSEIRIVAAMRLNLEEATTLVLDKAEYIRRRLPRSTETEVDRQLGELAQCRAVISCYKGKKADITLRILDGVYALGLRRIDEVKRVRGRAPSG